MTPQRLDLVAWAHRALGVVLLLVGCTDQTPTMLDTGSTGAEATTGSEASSSALDGDAGTADSTGSIRLDVPPPRVDCNTPREIPPPPFDCSGADGVITSTVIIEEGGDDPSILEGVRRVEGSLFVLQTDLTNLDFMACVEEVTGEITIWDNDSLTNVDGLWSMRELGGNFVFSDNDAIVEFDSLPNLATTAGQRILFRSNTSLEGISGFHSLVLIDDYLWFDENSKGTIPGQLLILEHPVLRHIDGFGDLERLEGIFDARDNPMLCGSSVACVLEGLVVPTEIPPEWWTGPFSAC